MEHVVTVRFMGAWGEWRPECSCGWTGSYWPFESQAEHEAATSPMHRREP